MSRELFPGDWSLELSEKDHDEKKESDHGHFLQQPLNHELLIQAINNLDIQTIKSYCDGLDQHEFENLINEDEINEAIVSLRNNLANIEVVISEDSSDVPQKRLYEFCTEQGNRDHCFDIKRLPGQYLSWTLNPEDEMDEDEEIIGFSSNKVLVWDKTHELYKESAYPISSCAIAIEVLAFPFAVGLRLGVIAATQGDITEIEPCCSPYEDYHRKAMFERFVTKLIRGILRNKANASNAVIDYFMDQDPAHRQAHLGKEEKGELSLSDELDQAIRTNDLKNVQEFFQNHSINPEMRAELKESVAGTLDEIISSFQYQSQIVDAIDLSNYRGTKLEKLYFYTRSIANELSYGKHVMHDGCNAKNPREYILIRDISLERGKESENSYIVGVGKNNDGVAVLLKQKDGRLEEMKVHKKAKSSLYIQLCLCAPFYVLANLVCGYTPEYDGIQNYDYIQPVISDTTIDGAFQRVVHLRAMGIKSFVESQLAEVVEEEKVDSAHCCTIS